MSQHIWLSSYLVFCTGIFKWLQHSWIHISRSYVYKNVEEGNDQTLEGHLSSDFEMVVVCWESSDKTLGSKMAGNLLNEWLYLLSFQNMLLHTSANRSWPRLYYIWCREHTAQHWLKKRCQILHIFQEFCSIELVC